MSDRRILITGGSGYVGSALVPVVAAKYACRVLETMTFGNSIAGTPNVEFIQGDIRDRATVAAALEGVTDVIHLAAVVTDDLVDMGPEYSRQVNCEALRQLASLSAHAGVRRLIYASSSSVYGTQDAVCSEDSPTLPMTEYAKTKLMGEQIINPYARAMTVASVRCATACGPAPRMRFDTIVNIFCKQAYFDGKITVHGGGQYRTNIHVRDVADFYLRMLDYPAGDINGEAFNLSRGYHTARELAEMVQRASPTPCQLFIDTGKVDNRHYRMDAGKALARLGWRAKRSIEQAIQDNFEFFAAGNIADPNSDLYFNTRRMAATVKGG